MEATLNILTEIDVETATAWTETIVRFRSAQLRRKGDSVQVSTGAAIIDLLSRRNGPSTRIAIGRGRFDERNVCYQSGTGKNRKRVYGKTFDGDTMGTTYNDDVATQAHELLASLDDRQAIVARGIMAGKTYNEIGNELNVSGQTVCNIVATIRNKFAE